MEDCIAFGYPGHPGMSEEPRTGLSGEVKTGNGVLVPLEAIAVDGCRVSRLLLKNLGEDQIGQVSPEPSHGRALPAELS